MPSAHYKRPREAVASYSCVFEVQQIVCGEFASLSQASHSREYRYCWKLNAFFLHTTDLHHVVSYQQRIQIIDGILNCLGYHPVSQSYQHGQFAEMLVECGAIHALCLQLGFVANKISSGETEELQGILTLIHLLCQCDEKVIEQPLDEIGSDLYDLMVRVLKKSQNDEKKNEKIIQSILYTWHLLASHAERSIKMLTCQGLVGALVYILRRETVHADVNIEAIGIVKHLTYFAENYRVHLLDYPDLIPSLSRLTFTNMHEISIERLSAIFRNLACTTQARKGMVTQSIILAALVQLSKGTSRRTTRNLLFTLGSLAMEPDSAMPMILFGEGMLVTVLVMFLGANEDETTRRQAARALRLLARDKAAALLSRIHPLLDRLSDVALYDSSQSVRLDATEAFANCAAYIQSPMPNHDSILASLAQLSSGPAPDAVAKALKEQATVPVNRPRMAESVDLLSALAKLALRDHTSNISKEHVANVLLQLSNDEGNREKMVTEQVLTSLVKTCQQNGIREIAVLSLLNLASVESNRKGMASHFGLLRSLVQFVASNSPSPSLKNDVKKTIVMLVPLL